MIQQYDLQMNRQIMFICCSYSHTCLMWLYKERLKH